MWPHGTSLPFRANESPTLSSIPTKYSARATGGPVRQHNLSVSLPISNPFEYLWESVEQSHTPQPLSIIDRWIPTHHLARRHIIGDPRLRRRHHSIADLTVAGNSNLAGENHVFAHLCRTGQLQPAHESNVSSPTVDPCPTCTRLSIFAPALTLVSPIEAPSTQAFACTSTRSSKHGRPRLPNFVPAFSLISASNPRKAKAICTNDRAILQNNVIAQSAMLPHNSMSMRHKPCTHPHKRIEHYVRM